jgi:hypothetical protein
MAVTRISDQALPCVVYATLSTRHKKALSVERASITLY